MASFVFKYSVRPGTKGAELLADDVPLEVKQRRNNELLAVQDQISSEDNEPFLGRTVEVLVEGPSKLTRRRHADDQFIMQLTGRTPCDRIVVFDGTRRQIGHMLPVTILDSTAYTLYGTVVKTELDAGLLPVLGSTCESLNKWL